MRKFLTTLMCCSLLLSAAPVTTFAATTYFESDGRSTLDGAALNHNFTIGIDGNTQIRVNRGPARWVLVGGRFPNGIGIMTSTASTAESTVTIGGRATEEGSFPVRLLALVGDASYFLDYTVTAYNQTLAINPIGVAQGRVGLPYLQPLTATGSVMIASDLYWGISAGALPPGLNLNTSTGEISGTPTTAGEYRFLVRMNERSGLMRSANPREYLQTIQPTTVSPVHITTRTNPVNGQVGVTYPAQIFRASGGSGSYQWELGGGALPPGLTLGNTTGILQGTPTVAGTYSFIVKASDAMLSSNMETFGVTVTIAPAAGTPTPTPTPTPSPTPTPTPIPTPTPTGGALTLVTTSMPSGTVGVDYSTTLSASGGTTPYSWNFASGNLPPGLTLSGSGIVSGRPTTAGTYTAYIEVFDNVRTFTGRSLTVTINAAGTTPTPTPTPTPSPSPSPSPSPTPTTSPSTELTTLLNNFTRIGVSAHALVKLPDDGNPATQNDSAVYYLGTDGRRHAFPNDRVFFSWYSNFDGVRVVSQTDLASIPLGRNATYRPGVKMVKFTTDPKVYAIGANRALRWVKTEAAAIALYGTNWNRQIDDLSDSFYTDYTFGADINAASDYDRTSVQAATQFVSDTFGS